MTQLLEGIGLCKRFGGLHAIQDLSFTVSEGEILGLIGPNGAGKSTLFNLINGVYPPDQGRIIFKGRDITGRPPYRVARSGIARAHQIVQPLAGLTVLQNCMVGACFGRERMSLARAHEIVTEVTQFVGLRDRLEALASALTTAGKKRLELARALCSRPYLLLLDEALAGLNPSEIDGMCEVIRNVRDRGVTILMIEHVMRAIMNLSDRVIVLTLGRKMAEGVPSAVASNPQVIATYLGEAPDVVSGARTNG